MPELETYLPNVKGQAMTEAVKHTPRPAELETAGKGQEECVLCGQASYDLCQEIDAMASSGGEVTLPSKDDVRRALETLNRANGADLDEWTSGVLPSDEIAEAFRSITATETPRKQSASFPPSSCTAWEDCDHDGICHDRQQCKAIGPNEPEDRS